jgi:asparagine synthase (glutamine-hydrolysing)
MGGFGVGVYAGGGVDSSIVAYYTKKFSRKDVLLFSLTFSDPEYDESYYQKIISSYLNLPLISVHIDTEKIFKNLKRGVYYCETPLIRTAPVPLILLSKKVKEAGVKFVLCGEGADELFAGYPVFLKKKSSIEDKWRDNFSYIGLFQDRTVRGHVRATYKLLLRKKPDRGIDRLRKIEMSTKLSGYLLSSQGDRVSMASGVEQRFSYLDTSIMKLAFEVGVNFLMDQREGKIVLKRIAQSILPEEITNRRKQGYLTPDIAVALRLLKERNYQTLLSEEVIKNVGIFNSEEVRKVRERFMSAKPKDLKDARILIFIATTHLLDGVFCERENEFEFCQKRSHCVKS